VRTQGELIAAVPALIGFHPLDSLVLVATGGESGGRIGLIVRIDLPPEPSRPEQTTAAGDSAVASLLLDDPAGAIVLVVCRDNGADGRAGVDPPQAALVRYVVDELEERGIVVRAAMWAEGTAAGARWRCYDGCCCSGVVADPAISPVLAAAVAGGQVVHADRAALERLVEPADHERLMRREALLVEAIDRELEGMHSDDHPEDGTDDGPDRAAALARVDAAIAETAAGRLDLSDDRSDDLVVALATALADHTVRDTALLHNVGPQAAAAEQLWVALTRETPDPEAAEPATLLAVSALLRGDGALANVALERAERAWPGHRLSSLIRIAVAHGVRPPEVRQWLLGCAPETEASA
jgi:hypothetical protein